MTTRLRSPVTIDRNAGNHPRGWPWVPLTDVARLATGHTPDRDRPDYWNGGISWISLTEIRGLDGRVAATTDLQVSPEGIRHSSAVVLPEGTVCFSRTASVGFVTIMGAPMATSQDFVNWICGDELDPRYLMHALRSSRRELVGLSSGSTHKTIYVRVAEQFRVLLPPLEEQRRIAAMLDQADDLRKNRLASVALLETLTEAIFLDMFGATIRNPKGWESRRLADVSLEIQIGPFGSLLHQSDYVEGGVPLVNPMHIVDDEIVPDTRHAVATEKVAALQRYVLREGDIVMARRGEMGRCAVVGTASAGMVCGSGSLFIRPDLSQVGVRFLHEVLTSKEMKEHLERKALGVTMANLNSDIVGDLPILLPPRDLQERFAAAAALGAVQRERQASGAITLDRLLSSLTHRAFAGQL